MSELDIVTELDRWLDNSNDTTTPIDRRMVRRARDEIMALRSHIMRQAEMIRAEALEEAAKACERLVNRETWPENYHPLHDPDPYTCGICAAWILKLKGDL